jgi:hypothetical protein
MAKKTPDLFDQLRASGLRKRAARTVADAVNRGRGRTGGKPPKAVQSIISDLRGAATEIESRVTGGRSKKRKAAAQKAAATRKRKAAKRSAAAKKGSRTRAKAGR